MENGQWQVYKEQFKEAFHDLKTKGRRKRQIPNILTSLRLLSPFIILPASFLGNIPLVIGAVVAFSITDLLDGVIARACHFTSDLGRDLDAFTDKIFAGTLLLAASVVNPIMLLTLSLEAGIAFVNVKAKLKGQNPKSLLIGKVKTAFLFPLLGLSLISSNFSLETIFQIFLGTTTALQVFSVASYERKYREEEQRKKEEWKSREQEVGNSPMEEQNRPEKTLGEKEMSKISRDLRDLRSIRDSLTAENDKSEEKVLKK